MEKIQFQYHDALVIVRVWPCCLSICQQRESEIRPISIRSLSLFLYCSAWYCVFLSVVLRSLQGIPKTTLLYFYAFPPSFFPRFSRSCLLYIVREQCGSIRFSRQRASISGCTQPLWRCHYSTTNKEKMFRGICDLVLLIYNH